MIPHNLWLDYIVNLSILLLYLHRIEKLRSKIVLQNFFCLIIYIYIYMCLHAAKPTICNEFEKKFGF